FNGVGLCWEGGGVMGEVVGEVERGWEVMEMWHGSWRDFCLWEALYGLKQAPRAWYDELSKFLTSKGLQIHQSPRGIFINQARYTLEILHKHGMDKGQSIGTPMATKPKLDADLSGNPVDQTDYRSKIGSLMYLTSSRPDLVQTDSSFELIAFSDADHAGCIDTHKSTSGGIQFLGDKLVSWMSKKQNCTAMSLAEAEYVALSAGCAQVMWMRTQLQDYGFNYNKIPVHYMFTKALPEDRFKYLVRRIGIKETIMEFLRGTTKEETNSSKGASHGQNPPPSYQASAYQVPGYQALMITASSSGTKTLPSNTVTNPKEDLKGITTRSGNAYQGPMIPTTSSSPHKVVERETEVTKDTVPPTNNESTKDVQPLVVQVKNEIPNFDPVLELVVAPVSAPKPNQKLSIPYSSRLHDQKEKIFKIFKELDFNISFADALILMPKFGLTIKSLLTNKEKLYDLARTPLNEHCSVVLLKKLPEKLRDPGKFLIPCDFSRMDECLALADLDTSINLVPLSVWNKLSLRELTPTLMTLKLADRSIS
nr:reverse transcriptase domain-containing protein [Tanacetum cinerariifolium]